MHKGLSTQIEIGKQYSGLIPLEISGRDPNGNPTFYNCKCVRCGAIVRDVHFMDIAWYRVRCCNNCDPDDLTGMRFTKLVAVEKVDLMEKNGLKPDKKKTRWRCKCDCGGEKVIRRDSLLLGLTRSCGCIKNYDMVGKRFGYLTVTKEIGMSSDHMKRYFYCKCDCGANVVVAKGNLVNGHTRSCGRCARTLDLKGKRFGRLTVIKLHPSLKRNTNRVWVCRCDCGKIVYVPGHSLTSGHTKSCGCLTSFKKQFATEEERRLSGIFYKMVLRCYDKKNVAYPGYGGRGIYICDEWKNDRFKFIRWSLDNGYKIGLSIDRIDNDGPYAPWNCRWVTMKEQNRNKRSNHFIIVDGVKKTMTEWCELTDLPCWRLWELCKKHGDDYVAMVIYAVLERKKRKNSMIIPPSEGAKDGKSSDSI